MDFIKLLLTKSKLFYFLLTLTSVVTGLLNIAILYFINNFVTQNPLMGFFMGYDYAVYMAAIVLSVSMSFFFQRYLIKITNEIVVEFEVEILKTVGEAKLESFEKLGKERVFTAINDTRTLARIPSVAMNVVNAFVIVVGSFIYMFVTSWLGSLILVGAMLFLLIVYLKRNSEIEIRLNLLRDLQDKYYQFLNDLLFGYRELKTDRKRNDNIISHFLIKNRQESKEINLNTSIQYMNNELIGSYSWYIVIGVILFALPKLMIIGMNQQSTFILTILFMMGSVGTLISVIPTYTSIKIAIERLNIFSADIKTKLKKEVSSVIPVTDNFELLEAQALTYSYVSTNKSLFTLGPIDFVLRKGEIVFIVGGNGSGKSTFVKLITGLYQSSGGMISYNRTPISYDQLKDHVSVVFSDAFLFSENYNGFVRGANEQRLLSLIELMQLTDVVRMKEYDLVFDTNLSTGQRKRIALIYALLENKPILLLDEWAAEQDPQFRSHFYHVILKQLVSEGKTIVAISHDDKYFNVASRVIKFEYGRIADATNELNQIHT